MVKLFLLTVLLAASMAAAQGPVVWVASPWQHVRPLGEDIVQTELVLPRGQHLVTIE